MLLLSSMIVAVYLLEGMAVTVDWSSGCPDSFSNLDETKTRKIQKYVTVLICLVYLILEKYHKKM